MQTSAVMSSEAELSKSKTSRQAMGWAVGLATAATVGAVAIPLCAAMGGVALATLPVMLIASAKTTVLTKVAIAALASQLWTAPVVAGAAMIGGGVGALMGSAIGVIGGIDGHRAGAHEVQYRGMPADISGKLKMWREQTGEAAAKVGKDIASSMAHSI